MDRAEAIEIVYNEMPMCGEKVTYSESERCEAYTMAIASLREQEQKSSCSLCGYGGKHLDAPPCTKCPAHPKEQEQSKWISVKDQTRMPPEKFLAVTKWGKIVLVERRSWGDRDWLVGGLYLPEDIKWWMPLPEPPAVQPSDASPSGNVNRKEGADHA